MQARLKFSVTVNNLILSLLFTCHKYLQFCVEQLIFSRTGLYNQMPITRLYIDRLSPLAYQP